MGTTIQIICLVEELIEELMNNMAIKEVLEIYKKEVIHKGLIKVLVDEDLIISLVIQHEVIIQ